MTKFDIQWHYYHHKRKRITKPVSSCSVLVLSIIFVQLCILRTVVSQRICSGDVMRTYKSCVLDNTPCPCSECDADPTDGTPVNFVDAPRSCEDIYDIFCPFVRCCSKCQDAAYGWYQCSADNVAERWLQVTCDLQSNCDDYPVKDDGVCSTDGDYATTTSSSSTSEVKTPVPPPTKAPKSKSTIAPISADTNTNTTEKADIASLVNEATSSSWIIPLSLYESLTMLLVTVTILIR